MSNILTYRHFRPWLLILSILLSLNCAGQTRAVQVLKKHLKDSGSGRDSLQIALQICDHHESLAPDSMYYYAAMAVRLAQREGDKEGTGLANYYLATLLQKRGLLDSCRRMSELYLKELRPDQYDLHQKFNYLQSTLLVRSNQPQKAIEQFYKILRKAEKREDTLMQSISKNGIGWGYMEMNNYQEALHWFRQALSQGGTPAQQRLQTVVYSNMAAVYSTLEQFDSTEYYVTKAIALARKLENLTKIANGLNIQADLYMLTGRKKLAEQPLREALTIREKIGDPFYVVSDMYQLALYYVHSGNPDKGVEMSKKGIELCKQYALSSKLPILYNALAESYKAAGDDGNYSKTLEKIIAIKDSTYRAGTAEALAEMQAKYDVEKKENIIIRQKLSILRQNYLFYGALMLSVFVVIIALVLFRSYRRKEKIRLAQLMLEEKRAAGRAVQEAEEKERKRIAADLHDNLGAYAASISSNIDHISLHSAQDPGNISILQELKNNSQEMVAQLSDTIWTLKRDALSLTAISDRLKVYMQKINSSYPNIKMDVIEKIENDAMLSPSQAFHLFRITQEAINNAVRHSGADQLTVTIESVGSWRVSIEDNGAGMRNKEFAREGNGIYNMKSRAETSGWKIAWVNGTGGGLSVIIKPSTTN